MAGGILRRTCILLGIKWQQWDFRKGCFCCRTRPRFLKRQNRRRDRGKDGAIRLRPFFLTQNGVRGHASRYYIGSHQTEAGGRPPPGTPLRGIAYR